MSLTGLFHLPISLYHPIKCMFDTSHYIVKNVFCMNIIRGESYVCAASVSKVCVSTLFLSFLQIQ